MCVRVCVCVCVCLCEGLCVEQSSRVRFSACGRETPLECCMCLCYLCLSVCVVTEKGFNYV